MQLTPEIASLAAALCAAQAEVENAGKNAQNPHLKNRYADLAEVVNTVLPVFNRHGLSVIQCPSYDRESKCVKVETFLLHGTSGQFLGGELAIPVSKEDAQGVGSAITYGRRYALAALACIGQEDDDGEGAVGSKRGPAKAAAPRPVAEVTGLASSIRASLDAVAEGDKAAFEAIVPLVRGLTAEAKAGLRSSFDAARARALGGPTA